jgi:CubicO group peptidase (beta-lactamase class C family)
VIAARGDKIVVDQAYGWADRARRRRMGRDTAIGVASVTKQFTAASILKLKEAGRLDLNDPLSRFLPEAPADKAGLSLHQLLTHTAGMPPGDVLDDFEATSKADLLWRVLSAAGAGPPGEKWRYSNAGYNLLAFVIERASGRDYETFVADELFKRAGMRDSGFPGHWSLAGSDPAHAYRAWLDEGTPASWTRVNLRPFGSGTAFSTASDLYRWQLALEGGRILKPEDVKLLTTPHFRIGGEDSPSYGYGAFIERQKAGTFIERSGDWERGYNAAWHRWPEEDLTLIVTSNSATAAGFSMRQSVQGELENFLRETEPAPAALPVAAEPPPAVLRQLAGRYRLPSGDLVELLSDGTYLWARAEGQAALHALRTSDGKPEENLDAAVQKTNALLAGLLTGDGDAFRKALGPERGDVLPEYLAEWSGLTAKHGALRRVRVLGAMRQGRSARAVARMDFERRPVLLGFFWGERGKGALVGTQPDLRLPAALAYPMGLAPDGGLAGFEMMNSSSSSPKLHPSGLMFGGILAARER